MVDAFIEELDLSSLSASNGFSLRRRVTCLSSGNAFTSTAISTASSRAVGWSVEPMSLTGRLVPDFKTIADFRRVNGTASRAVCTRFILICGQLGLFSCCCRHRRRQVQGHQLSRPQLHEGEAQATRGAGGSEHRPLPRLPGGGGPSGGRERGGQRLTHEGVRLRR